MSEIGKIGVLLVFYALLFVVIRIHKKRIEPNERKAFWVLYFTWAGSMFIANYVGYLMGIMSFLPWWPNNFLHTFVWIGVCLTSLYFSVRHEPMVVQMSSFMIISLVVKYAEQQIFGVWEMEHFLHIFRGNAAYIIGWSTVDGLYPPLTLLLLRLLSKWVRGLDLTPSHSQVDHQSADVTV